VGEGIEVIVSSDLRRAAETAAILGDALGLRPVVEPRLRELDIGAWTGLRRVEIEARDGAGLRRFESGEPAAPAGGGESRIDVARRTRRAASDLADRYRGRCVAVVCHLGVVRALLPGTELTNAAWCRASAGEVAARADGAEP